MRVSKLVHWVSARVSESMDGSVVEMVRSSM